MNATKVYCLVSGIVFAIVAALHLLRNLSGWAFVFGPYQLCPLISWGGFIGAGALAIWGLSRIGKIS
ncbi:MAG: hypothetical protein GXO70_04515 [Acidobacteria bacterium]|nr:hypothetical protein [Acidobacteriota bacterium]